MLRALTAHANKLPYSRMNTAPLDRQNASMKMYSSEAVAHRSLREDRFPS